jgi:outer membrane immunogenic protein
MKRLFSTSALVGLGLCVAQNALAANLPMPAMAPPAPPPPSWTGFYLGANASMLWTDPVTFTGAGTFGVAPPFALTTSASDIGMALGPIVGYNLQMGSFLLGVESDIDWGILSSSANLTPLPGLGTCGAIAAGPATFINCSSFTSKLEVGTLASVRGRAGWIWNIPKSDWTFNTPGDFLFYGTGGVGWAHESYQSNIAARLGRHRAPPLTLS